MNFPFWDITLSDRIIALGFEVTDQIREVVKIELPNLINIFEKSSLPVKPWLPWIVKGSKMGASPVQ